MKTDHQGTGAKIYAFPVNRIVRSSGMRELEAIEKGSCDHFVDTDSWYHEDAIKDQSNEAKRPQ